MQNADDFGFQKTLRWQNYYLKGLQHVMQQFGVDGLYLDGIGFDRSTMKRARVLMDASLESRPGGKRLIDVHSGNSFPEAKLGNSYPPVETACSSGCVSGALRFMQHWPYVDSTMMGEEYDYDAPADYYLIEISSLAWGIGNDMCCNGPPNVWRGMVFGMVSRYDVGMCDAYGMRTTHPPDKTAMWTLWDDFDLPDASMVGYWHPNPLVNITSQHSSSNCSEVYATTYLHVGQRALVAIGSWQPGDVQHCSLEVDWAGLGFRTTQYVAPALSGFQPSASFAAGSAIPVPGGKGLLLLLSSAAAPPS
jgi:hypothetical protein